LLLIIFGTHYTYDLAAPLYENQVQAARILFYIARGMEGAILFGLVWLFASGTRVVVDGASFGLACLWGVVEEAQTSICQMAHGIVTIEYTPFVGLCGLPSYWWGVAAAGWLAVSILDKIRRR
jgi:hypothetical protein